MFKFFHITGTVCSGKSFLIQKIKERFPDVCVSWDILNDFYIKHDLLVDNRIDFDRYYKMVRLVPLEIENLIETNPGKIIFLETSGLNERIQQFLPKIEKRYGPITTVQLKIPNEEELERRAIKRNIDVNRAVGFAINFSSRVSTENSLSLEQAQELIEKEIFQALITE